MKENKTLAQLYQISPEHKFGDLSLKIENKNGRLRGRFIFHQIATDRVNLETALAEQGIPSCFGHPPILIDSDVTSRVIWDESFATLGEVIPQVEEDIKEFSQVVDNMGKNLRLCAECPVFDRCYRIAEINLARKSYKENIQGKWEM